MGCFVENRLGRMDPSIMWSLLAFVVAVVFKGHLKKERTWDFGSAHSLVDAQFGLGTEPVVV